MKKPDMKKPEKPKEKVVLITTPSLDTSHNVSGVASVVQGIVAASKGVTPTLGWKIALATIGKRDDQKRDAGWALTQLAVPLRFAWLILRLRPHIVHINGPLNTLAAFRDMVLLALARLYTKRVIYHVHGGAYVHVLPDSKWLRRVITLMLRIPSTIIVLGKREAESLVLLYGIERARILVLANAVNIPAEVQSRAQMGSLRVLSMGRLSPEKGLGILCEAFERHADLPGGIELHVYGAGTLESEVIPRLQLALCGNFRFGGVAGPKERTLAYRWADVVVMPSLHGEGLPMVLLEAMSFGVVPITTADGSIADVVEHGVNGLIVEKNDWVSLAQAINSAINMKSTGALKIFSAHARLKVERNHSARDYAGKLNGFYNKIA